MRTAILKQKQKGVASVLLVLIAGLGIIAAVMGTSAYIRGTQDQHLSTHSLTQAQLRAWEAVEVIRQYFATLDSTALSGVGVGNLAINGLDGVTANIVSNVANASGGRRITVNVTGIGANASAIVQAVFDAAASSSSGGEITSTNAINIRKSLRLSGSVDFTGNSAMANFNVDGNVSLDGSVTGINRLCATGDISISSGISVNTICTNGSLTLSGAANVTRVTAIGNVYLKGGSTSIDTVVSNGSVVLDGGSASTNDLQATGNVTVGGNAKSNSIISEGNVDWTSSNSTQSISANGYVTYTGGNNSTNINAIGDVSLSGNGNVNNLNTKGNTSISSTWGSGVQGTLNGEGRFNWQTGIKVNSGTVGKSISPALSTRNSWEPDINVTKVAGYSVNVPTVSVPKITAFTVPPVSIDAYALKTSANYVFEVDASGRRTVTVKNVNSIPDGKYFLGNYSGGHMDYLCTALDANNSDCTAPSSFWKTICQGYSDWNGCITYDAGTSQWTINGISLAAGVAWFEGNLNIANGKYFNTFITTGNVSTGGYLESYSVNYAGYQAICANNRTSYGQSVNTRFSDIYPTNFCNTTSGQFISNAIGNVAMVAGGYVNNTFKGGIINLGAGNKIFGSILAGDILGTGGSTTVYGQVIASGQNPSSSGSMDWSGATSIIIPTDITGFDSSKLECMVNCSSGAGQVKVIWSRYL